jgi:EAL domain-containing protein (putative c-di-GMP-specific phosphodiesterase class I)/CheY-like chemotaxis protein
MTKILLIEDDEHLRTLYKYYLRDNYSSILEADNGWSGVELAVTQQPDLIISDIYLPGLNGYEVLEKLSQNPATYHIPFIFLTGEDSRTSFRKGMELGADDYLTKPVKRAELLEAVTNRLLRREKLLKYYAQQPQNITNSPLQSSLYTALENSQLEIYYQPQVKTRSCQLAGVEALLRWHHPEYGTISPLNFIPLAEASGLIEPITEWLLKTACQQVRRWQETLQIPLRLAVNVSQQQFKPSLVTFVQIILEETTFPAQCLELELTESTLVSNSEQVKSVMADFKKLGVRLALDDFGVGYSALSYLKQFQFDTLKIDRAFIDQCDNSSDDRAILTAILSLAHSLELNTIGEGVETRAELQVLAELDCAETQGYLFAKPLSVEGFERWTHSFWQNLASSQLIEVWK